jgi:hypothetical protein
MERAREAGATQATFTRAAHLGVNASGGEQARDRNHRDDEAGQAGQARAGRIRGAGHRVISIHALKPSLYMPPKFYRLVNISHIF